MKKLVVISIMAAMLLSIAAAAMATETNWYIYLRASNLNGGDAAAPIKMGTNSLKTNAQNVGDNAYAPNTGVQAQCAIYNANWGGTPAYYVTDMRAPLSYSNFYLTWDIRVWVAPGWAGGDSFKLSWYGSSIGKTMPLIGGLHYQYKIRVIDDPTGTYRAGTIWEFPAGGLGSATSPLDSRIFNNASAVKMADGASIDGGIKLQFMTVPPIPEPSSMMALASGLVGMGFAIRRKGR